MSAKKIIGMLIGIIAFAALIAGATFAWLSATTVINNTVFNGISQNFIITYSGSADVSDFKQLGTGEATVGAITSATNANVSGDAWAAVVASKGVGTAPAGSFKIKLHISENSLTTDALVWAICKGNCPTSTALATVSDGSANCGSGVTNCGTIPAGDVSEIQLYNDTTTFNTDDAVSDTTYNVYFWIDTDTLSVNDMGKTFNGYIYADAVQAG